MAQRSRGWLGGAALLSICILIVACGSSGSAPDAGDDRADAAPRDAAPPDGSVGNATLASLTPSVGVLVPAFEPELTEYDLDLGLAVAFVSFTPTAADAAAAITIAGIATPSAVSSAPLPLVTGSQDLDIVVVSSGNVTTYRVHVHRGVDALASLQLAAGGAPLARPLSPGFDPATQTYQVDVGLWLDRLELAAVPLRSTATITVAGAVVPSGQLSAPVSLPVGQSNIQVVIDGGGLQRTYTIQVTRGSQAALQAYAKASNTGAGDAFGLAVALYGDTLVVGAPAEDSAGSGVDTGQSDNTASAAGAVYVFTRTGATWTQQAYLKASNTDGQDAFGQSLALHGDTLAVGAPMEDSGAAGVNGNQGDNSVNNAGAVYVFTRTGTTWTQQAYLKASTPQPIDLFGWRLALWGDTLAVTANGEGSAATGVGADETDDSLFFAGAAYVFVRTGSTWSQQAFLKASNTGDSDTFGDAVSLWGDTLAIGAPNEDSGATGVNGDGADNSASYAGAAYVFMRSGTTWSQQAYLKASNTDSGDLFGVALSLWDDTLAVGAPSEDSAGTNEQDNSVGRAGAVYVFTRSSSTWTQQVRLKSYPVHSLDEFGTSVALSGHRLAIGAPGEGSNATGIGGDQNNTTAALAGAAYVFVRNGTVWIRTTYVKASNTGADDLFGRVALWGDTLVVGAQQEDSAAVGVGGNQADNTAAAAGAVYVYR